MLACRALFRYRILEEAGYSRVYLLAPHSQDLDLVRELEECDTLPEEDVMSNDGQKINNSYSVEQYGHQALQRSGSDLGAEAILVGMVIVEETSPLDAAGRVDHRHGYLAADSSCHSSFVLVGHGLNSKGEKGMLIEELSNL